MEVKNKPLMYKENVKSINAFVGCLHQCVYCVPSFQRICKWSKCLLHKSYLPHSHLERFKKRPPKTQGDEFIFFPSCGDLAFASPRIINAHIQYAKDYPDRTFLMQSKDLRWIHYHDFPDNVILGTTIETDRIFFDTPSGYKTYRQISKAPPPASRYYRLIRKEHPLKLVTIEPILQFSLRLTRWIENLQESCDRLIVYIGYDNHKCKLPEPTLNETLKLIEDLKSFLPPRDLRLKSIRKAWFEG